MLTQHADHVLQLNKSWVDSYGLVRALISLGRALIASAMVQKSWVDVMKNSDFPLQNLPFGVFSTAKDARPRAGVAIGNYVIDLPAASKLKALAYTKAAQTSCFTQVSLGSLHACYPGRSFLGRYCVVTARSLPKMYHLVFMQDSLNEFMSLGREEWRQVREAVTSILREDNPILRDDAILRKQILIPMVRSMH